MGTLTPALIGRLVYLLVLLPWRWRLQTIPPGQPIGTPYPGRTTLEAISRSLSMRLGSYAGIGHVFPFKIIPVLCLLFLGSIALFDRRASTNTRRLAWFLLIAQAGVLVISQLVSSVLLPAAVALSVISILALSSGVRLCNK